MARALEGVGVAGVEIKWPNDLQIRGAKLGGILVEGGYSGSRYLASVGVGVNLIGVPPSVTDRELASVAAVSGSESEFSELRSRLLSGYLGSLDEAESKALLTPGVLLGEYRSLLSTTGREVVVEMGDGALAGMASGVDGQGRLIVDTATGRRVVASGDVIHLRGAGGEKEA